MERRQVILRPLMFRLRATGPLRMALALLLLAGLGACATPCEELGHKLCECRGSGTTRRSCEKSVDDELNRLKPSKADQDVCEAALKRCDGEKPKGVAFCTWLEGEDGKLACGIALPKTP